MTKTSKNEPETRVIYNSRELSIIAKIKPKPFSKEAELKRNKNKHKLRDTSSKRLCKQCGMLNSICLGFENGNRLRDER